MAERPGPGRPARPRRVAAGTWVELHAVLLEPGARAPQVPPDTQAVPLELRVSGVLVADAAVGDEAQVRTAAGRTLTGTLAVVEPAPTHAFGPPVPELLHVGPQLRALLAARRSRPGVGP